jgi:hypothetical protein
MPCCDWFLDPGLRRDDEKRINQKFPNLQGIEMHYLQ